MFDLAEDNRKLREALSELARVAEDAAWSLNSSMMDDAIRNAERVLEETEGAA